MKKIILLITAAVTGCFTFAQSRSNQTFICSYYGEPITRPVTAVNSSADARNVIANIIDVIGLEPKFEIRASNIPNAAAMISSGKRYILYNPTFISAINQAANDKWAAIAILAHEIGHHLNGHTLPGTGSHPASELEADQFSGFVLRKMGASLDQAQLSMKLVAEERASRTHPGKSARLVSIENGWNKADAQLTGGNYTARAIPTTPVATQRTTTPVSNRTYALHPKYVRFDVQMNGDRNNMYHITTENNFVTVRGAQLIVLGKVTSTGNSTYPLAITIDGKNEFYITKSGIVVNTRRQQVGNLKTNERA